MEIVVSIICFLSRRTWRGQVDTKRRTLWRTIWGLEFGLWWDDTSTQHDLSVDMTYLSKSFTWPWIFESCQVVASITNTLTMSNTGFSHRYYLEISSLLGQAPLHYPDRWVRSSPSSTWPSLVTCPWLTARLSSWSRLTRLYKYNWLSNFGTTLLLDMV